MIILTKNEFEYENEVVWKDEKTKNVLFQCDIKLTIEECQTIKDMFDEKKAQQTDEEILKLLFKENLEEMLEKVGRHFTDEFATMLAIDVVGKLAKKRMKNIKYVSTKYQDLTTR